MVAVVVKKTEEGVVEEVKVKAKMMVVEEVAVATTKVAGEVVVAAMKVEEVGVVAVTEAVAKVEEEVVVVIVAVVVAVTEDVEVTMMLMIPKIKIPAKGISSNSRSNSVPKLQLLSITPRITKICHKDRASGKSLKCRCLHRNTSPSRRGTINVKQ